MMIAQFDDVTVLQDLANQWFAVDLGAIVALQVFDDLVGTGNGDAGVPAAEQRVGDTDFVAWIAADADARLVDEILVEYLPFCINTSLAIVWSPRL